MDYEYDVFISYKTGDLCGRWVHERFHAYFLENLGQSLGREASVFIDKNDIADADSWRERIKHSLAKSKSLVAILSPLYFNSEWCKKECAAMLYREEQMGFRSLENPSGLISAIALHDGNSFPEAVNSIQYRKWHDYAVVGSGFEKTESFIDFQRELRDYAEKVAAIVRAAPPFDAKWLSDEWLERPSHNYNLGLQNLVTNQPVLRG